MQVTKVSFPPAVATRNRANRVVRMDIAIARQCLVNADVTTEDDPELRLQHVQSAIKTLQQAARLLATEVVLDRMKAGVPA